MLIPNLTPKQKELYLFIVEFVMENHNFPSIRDCKDGTSYGSESAIGFTLRGRFIQDSFLRHLPNKKGYSIVGLIVKPPPLYLEFKAPTFAAGLREAILRDPPKE